MKEIFGENKYDPTNAGILFCKRCEKVIGEWSGKKPRIIRKDLCHDCDTAEYNEKYID